MPSHFLFNQLSVHAAHCFGRWSAAIVLWRVNQLLFLPFWWTFLHKELNENCLEWLFQWNSVSDDISLRCVVTYAINPPISMRLFPVYLSKRYVCLCQLINGNENVFPVMVNAYFSPESSSWWKEVTVMRFLSVRCGSSMSGHKSQE